MGRGGVKFTARRKQAPSERMREVKRSRDSLVR